MLTECWIIDRILMECAPVPYWALPDHLQANETIFYLKKLACPRGFWATVQVTVQLPILNLARLVIRPILTCSYNS